ncbi:MAG: hypothetical protein ACRCVX_14140 [Shewanella sp.]
MERFKVLAFDWLKEIGNKGVAFMVMTIVLVGGLYLASKEIGELKSRIVILEKKIEDGQTAILEQMKYCSKEKETLLAENAALKAQMELIVAARRK